MQLRQTIFNPEDKFSITNSDKSNQQSISVALLQAIQEHIAHKQYQQAQQAAKGNIFLFRTVNSHLFLEGLTEMLEKSNDQTMWFEQQNLFNKRQEKLLKSVKELKIKKSQNKRLVEGISTVIKKLAYQNDTDWLDRALKKTKNKIELGQPIYKPLKHLWLKLSGQMSHSQLDNKLKKQQEECQQIKLQVISLKRQLELRQKQLKNKSQQITKMKQKEKTFLYHSIMTSDKIRKQNKLLHQESGKYIDQLQQVYNQTTPHQEQIQKTPTNDDSPINKLVAKMKQSISFHRSTFKNMIENHKNEVESLKRDYESQLEKLNANLTTASKNQFQRFKQQKSELQCFIQNNKQKVKQLQDSKLFLQQKLAEETKNKTQIQSKLAQQTTKLKNNIQTLERKLKIKDEEIVAERQFTEAFKSGLQEKDMLIQMNSQTLKNREEEILSLKKQLTTVRLRCKELEQNIQKITVSLKQSIQAQNLKQQSKDSSKIQEKYEQQLLEIKEEKAELQRKLQEMNIIRHKEKQELQSSVKQIQQAKSKISSLQKMLQLHKTKLKESEEKLNAANNKIISLNAETQFKKNHPEENVDGLFVNQILNSQPQDKLFIKNVLEQRYKSKIYRTNLVYKLDPLNKINFHQYIDNKQCLLAIIKLINGNIVAGYTQGKIYPKMVANKDGLIISVSNREVFQPIEINKKTAFYDDYFFILGNCEFRVRTGQLKFFSNLAVSNGYYKHRGMKINTLTGTNDRQIGMTHIQFYQIVFY